MPTADSACAMTVASAAPATPRWKVTTNSRSSTMLVTAETARKSSGASELLTARSRAAK